ncbi:hypothetical protein D3C87_413140 [compost metagenome]
MNSKMNLKALLPNALMLVGIAHMPFAFYLGMTQGMGPEMKYFTIGFFIFWSGYFLKKLLRA